MDGHRTRFGFWFCRTIPVSGAHNPKDRFETLCHVVADISASSWTRKLGTSGAMCCIQMYDVVLMVGLTELKAQIRWFDSTTVRFNN